MDPWAGPHGPHLFKSLNLESGTASLHRQAMTASSSEMSRPAHQRTGTGDMAVTLCRVICRRWHTPRPCMASKTLQPRFPAVTPTADGVRCTLSLATAAHALLLLLPQAQHSAGSTPAQHRRAIRVPGTSSFPTALQICKRLAVLKRQRCSPTHRRQGEGGGRAWLTRTSKQRKDWQRKDRERTTVHHQQQHHLRHQRLGEKRRLCGVL